MIYTKESSDFLRNYLKDNAELMKEYNYERNQSIDLNKITLGSNRKIWWKCNICSNEWETTPHNRSKGGTGCPICGLKKIGRNHNKAVLDKNGSLYDNRPDLAKEWDYAKNNPLTPKDVTEGSGKKVWWKCKNGHEWEARICNRTSGSGCIYCTRQKAIIGENDLATSNPGLLKEWDYEKNTNIKPEEVLAGSNKKVWWRCPLGHSWKASVSKRSGGTGCPHCYSEYGTSFPEQAILFYLSKVTVVESRKIVEKQEIDIFLPLFNVGFEYDGAYYHETAKRKEKETKKNEIIAKRGIELYHIKEADKNFFDANNRTIYCLIDRRYKYLEEVLKCIGRIINTRIEKVDIERDQTKIYSLYVKRIKDNNFTISHPELLKEWDYNKNEGLSPESLTIGSSKRVWWICFDCGSSFFTSVEKRIRYPKCPYCAGKSINESNNLESKYPNLMRYWDNRKNESIIPSKTYFSSRKKAWWICEACGNSYCMSICSRIKAKTNYCFDCKHKHIGDMNRLNSITDNNRLSVVRKELLKEWNYKRNDPLTPQEVSCASGLSVWWICSQCGNEWRAKIYNRVHGTGCPKCRRRKDN